MDYTIAVDDERSMSESWMMAAGRNGIPSAFIVGKDGTVEWIGHPATMDEPLEKIVDGSGTGMPSPRPRPSGPASSRRSTASCHAAVRGYRQERLEAMKG